MRALPLLFLASFSAAAAAPNWASVPAKSITLFTPGQTSLEWLMTPGEHKGADRFRAGAACLSCHTGQERVMGDVARKKYDRAPLSAQPVTLPATVQFARDADTLYVRLTFTDVPDVKQDTAVAKVEMMLDGGGTPEAAHAGCWAMCHDDSATMPSGKGPRTMYLGKTRTAMTRQGGGDALKPAGELARLKASGYGIEYWQVALTPAPVPANGLVFDKRTPKKTSMAATASHAGNQWTVVLSRKLTTGQVALVPGKKYAVAFAINAGHSAGRYHYVSFERSLVLGGGAADFVAK
jgi:cytochrome c-type protein NapC